MTRWDEPAGVTARGTLLLLAGRGETPRTYERFGRRLASDGYRVRFLPVEAGEVEGAAAALGTAVAQEDAAGPTVLLGTDAGASVAALLLASGDVPVDAGILVGTLLDGSRTVDGWEDEVAARSACPLHRQVIGADQDFARGSLGELPADLTRALDLQALRRPTLVLHGSQDPVTPVEAVAAAVAGADEVRLGVVEGGVHDVLNDAAHRSVAATVVLFLESLRLSPSLPAIVR